LYVIERELPGLVLDLIFPATCLSVANVVEVPAGDTSEIEDHLIPRLTIPVETWPVSGAPLRIVVKATRLGHGSGREKNAKHHGTPGVCDYTFECSHDKSPLLSKHGNPAGHEHKAEKLSKGRHT